MQRDSAKTGELEKSELSKTARLSSTANNNKGWIKSLLAAFISPTSMCKLRST